MVRYVIDYYRQLSYNNNTLKNFSNTLKRKRQMKFISKNTKTFKVFNALYNGAALTQSQAEKRFGVGNLAAEASRIRQSGCCLQQHT